MEVAANWSLDADILDAICVQVCLVRVGPLSDHDFAALEGAVRALAAAGPQPPDDDEAWTIRLRCSGESALCPDVERNEWLALQPHLTVRAVIGLCEWRGDATAAGACDALTSRAARDAPGAVVRCFAFGAPAGAAGDPDAVLVPLPARPAAAAALHAALAELRGAVETRLREDEANALQSARAAADAAAAAGWPGSGGALSVAARLLRPRPSSPARARAQLRARGECAAARLALLLRGSTEATQTHAAFAAALESSRAVPDEAALASALEGMAALLALRAAAPPRGDVPTAEAAAPTATTAAAAAAAAAPSPPRSAHAAAERLEEAVRVYSQLGLPAERQAAEASARLAAHLAARGERARAVGGLRRAAAGAAGASLAARARAELAAAAGCARIGCHRQAALMLWRAAAAAHAAGLHADALTLISRLLRPRAPRGGRGGDGGCGGALARLAEGAALPVGWASLWEAAALAATAYGRAALGDAPSSDGDGDGDGAAGAPDAQRPRARARAAAAAVLAALAHGGGAAAADLTPLPARAHAALARAASELASGADAAAAVGAAAGAPALEWRQGGAHALARVEAVHARAPPAERAAAWRADGAPSAARAPSVGVAWVCGEGGAVEVSLVNSLGVPLPVDGLRLETVGAPFAQLRAEPLVLAPRACHVVVVRATAVGAGAVRLLAVSYATLGGARVRVRLEEGPGQGLWIVVAPPLPLLRLRLDADDGDDDDDDDDDDGGGGSGGGGGGDALRPAVLLRALPGERRRVAVACVNVGAADASVVSLRRAEPREADPADAARARRRAAQSAACDEAALKAARTVDDALALHAPDERAGCLLAWALAPAREPATGAAQLPAGCALSVSGKLRTPATPARGGGRDGAASAPERLVVEYAGSVCAAPRAVASAGADAAAPPGRWWRRAEATAAVRVRAAGLAVVDARVLAPSGAAAAHALLVRVRHAAASPAAADPTAARARARPRPQPLEIGASLRGSGGGEGCCARARLGAGEDAWLVVALGEPPRAADGAACPPPCARAAELARQWAHRRRGGAAELGGAREAAFWRAHAELARLRAQLAIDWRAAPAAGRAARAGALHASAVRLGAAQLTALAPAAARVRLRLLEQPACAHSADGRAAGARSPPPAAPAVRRALPPDFGGACAALVAQLGGGCVHPQARDDDDADADASSGADAAPDAWVVRVRAHRLCSLHASLRPAAPAPARRVRLEFCARRLDAAPAGGGGGGGGVRCDDVVWCGVVARTVALGEAVEATIEVCFARAGVYELGAALGDVGGEGEAGAAPPGALGSGRVRVVVGDAESRS